MTKYFIIFFYIVIAGGITWAIYDSWFNKKKVNGKEKRTKK